MKMRIKSIAALIFCLVLLINTLLPLNILAAPYQGGEPLPDIYDDFSDATASKAMWETVAGQQYRGAPAIGNLGDYAIEKYDNRDSMRMAFGNAQSSPMLTTVKNWDTTRKTQKVETVFKLDASNQNQGVGSGAAIFAYQMNTKDALLLELYSSAGVIGVRGNRIYDDGSVATGGNGTNGCKNVVAIAAYLTGISQSEWAKMVITYEYPEANKLKLIIVTSKEDGTSPVIKSITLAFGAGSVYPESKYTDGFKVGIGSSSSNSTKAYFNYFAIWNDSAAGPDPGEDSYVYSDNFENPVLSTGLWETMPGHQLRGTPALGAAGDYSLEQHDGRGAMRAAYGNAASSSMLTTFGKWNKAREIKRVETVFKLDTSSQNMGSGASVFAFQMNTKDALLLELYSIGANTAVRWNRVYDDGTNKVGTGHLNNGAGNKVVVEGYSTGISQSEWVKMVITYEYPEANKLKLTVVTSKEDGSSPVSRSLILEFASASADYPASKYVDGFKVGIGSTSTATFKTYFDSFAIYGEQTPEEKALEYESKYEALLARNASSITSADADIIKRAFDEYDGLDETVSAYINDSTIEKLSELAKALYPTEWAAYLAAHGSLLSVSPNASNIKTMRTAIEAAMVAYQKLPDLLKRGARMDEYAHLSDLRIAAYKREKDTDLEPFFEDFEVDLSKWKKDYANSNDYTFNIIPDTKDEAGVNNALKMSGRAAFFSPVNAYWPSKGIMKELNVRFRAENLYAEARNPFMIVYSYVDKDNYYALNLQDGGWEDNIVNNPQQVRFSVTGRKDGTINLAVKTWDRLNPKLYVRNWVDVQIIYNTNQTVSIIVTDCYGNEANYNNLPALINGRFAIASDINGSPHDDPTRPLMHPMMLDDINVKFYDTPGDWDTNDEITQIRAYYSGNSWIKPGEIVDISGEQLGITVKKAEVLRLSDSYTSGNAAYTKQIDYESDGEYGNITKPSAASWNESGDVRAVKIFHKTRESIKFILPKDLTEGIFAVKLYPVSASADPVIIYLNDPKISFVMGDEGKITTLKPDGFLRIIGSNLAPVGVGSDKTKTAADIKVHLRKKGTNDDIDMGTPQIYEDDMYSLKYTNLSSKGLTGGEYEVFVYNGYGDSTAWSAPHVIEIGPSPRDKWPTDVFNVKSFGAIGDTDTNDTPAVIRALAAAHSNGGGVVYFPRGIYSIVCTLIIPENVLIKGDGGGESVMNFIATGYQYGDLAKRYDTFLAITKNVEVRDIHLRCVRVYNVIKTYASPNDPEPTNARSGRRYTYDENHNIYMNNVRITTQTRGSSPTESQTEGFPTLELTPAETMLLIKNEMNGAMVVELKGENVQLNNIEMVTDRALDGLACRNIWLNCAYLRLTDSVLARGTSHGSSSYAIIVEDNSFGPDNSIFLAMSHAYFARNIAYKNLVNNREGLNADGSPLIRNLVVSKLTDSEVTALKARMQTTNGKQRLSGLNPQNGCTYRVTSHNLAANNWEGFTVVIASGQGTGQVRTIKANKLDRLEGTDTFIAYITLDTPFVTEPNRNSFLYVVEPRHSKYHVNNTFSDIGPTGNFGTNIDSVYDNNRYTDGAFGASHDVHLSAMWYMSFINSTFDGGMYVHGEGTVTNPFPHSEPMKLQLAVQDTANYNSTTNNFVIRRNKLKNGTNIQVLFAGMTKAATDIIIEKNIVDSAEYAIATSNDQHYRSVDGLIIYDNDFDGSKSSLQPGLTTRLNESANKNLMGSPFLMMFEDDGKEIPDTLPAFLLGDVNLDRTVSLKDSTMVKMYLLGRLELNASQITAADVDTDKIVTLIDATLIRSKVLYPSLDFASVK